MKTKFPIKIFSPFFMVYPVREDQQMRALRRNRPPAQSTPSTLLALGVPSLLVLAIMLPFLLLLLALHLVNVQSQSAQPDPEPPLPVAKRELVMAQAVWRHGDRAPSKLPYPGDPYDEQFWPRGWSQLTNLGMAQMRELGQFLRNRYVLQEELLSAKYDPDEVYILSSNSDRALTSAQALLHGLFPALDEGDQFDPALQWQPIPVHSTGPNYELLKPTSFSCPVYEKLKAEVKLELERQLKVQYAELFEFLRTDVFNTSQPLSLKKAAKLNNINREVVHNLPQPPWVYRQWPQYGNRTTLELVTELRRLERTREFARSELAFLRGGFLLGDWTRRVDQIVAGETPAKKAVLYSSHDGTLQALLYAMGLGSDQLIPYAACVMMELYRMPAVTNNVSTLWQLEIFYRHNGVLERLHLAECRTDFCEGDEAVQLLTKRAIFDREQLYKECAKDGYCELPIEDDGD